MSKTPEKFALEDLTDEQKFDSYDGCPRCDEQLLIALDGYQDSRVWGTGGLVAATARAAKQAAYFAEKVATLETQRDEARAEVERLRKREVFAKDTITNFLNCLPLRRDWLDPVVEQMAKEFLQPEIVGWKPANTTPEIFEAHGLDWYAATISNTPPVSKKTRVDVLFFSGIIVTDEPASAWQWGWFEGVSPEGTSLIKGWRPADAPEKLPRK